MSLHSFEPHCLYSRILDALSPEADVDDEDETLEETASVIISSNGRPPSAISGTKVPNYDVYRRRLEPLMRLEERLTRLLTAPDEDEPTHLPLSWQNAALMNAPFKSNGRPAPTITIPHNSSQSQSLPVSPITRTSPTHSHNSTGSWKGKELSVYTSTNWRKAFALGGNRSKSPKSPLSGEIEGWWEDPDDPVHALNACAPAMQELWKDPCVRQSLEEKRIRLEESAGLYVSGLLAGDSADSLYCVLFLAIWTRYLALQLRNISQLMVCIIFVVVLGV